MVLESVNEILSVTILVKASCMKSYFAVMLFFVILSSGYFLETCQIALWCKGKISYQYQDMEFHRGTTQCCPSYMTSPHINYIYCKSF